MDHYLWRRKTQREHFCGLDSDHPANGSPIAAIRSAINHRNKTSIKNKNSTTRRPLKPLLCQLVLTSTHCDNGLTPDHAQPTILIEILLDRGPPAGYRSCGDDRNINWVRTLSSEILIRHMNNSTFGAIRGKDHWSRLKGSLWLWSLSRDQLKTYQSIVCSQSLIQSSSIGVWVLDLSLSCSPLSCCDYQEPINSNWIVSVNKANLVAPKGWPWCLR